ncbi:hypothetical protein CUMW_229470 [Citrus unshiu]|uniref:NB-ARC domain-containing protein n=1 Tax=Citrus unshiu TaxID=55188 RepID=A0A2H5QH11_CITUN|nr:hypothetical protein CUMW_229470 [Citrus unshiu]
MLLDDDENIFMHDVACDVAISITSREQNMFTATDELVSGWEWSDEGRLPVEVGQLTQLRSLDLRHCSNLQKHLPNLTSLELEVNDANTLPRGGLFLEKPERIDLDANVRLKDQDTVQLWGIEELSLAELLDHIKNFVNKLVKVGSSQLKYL